MGVLVRMIGTGIGLATEAVSQSRSNKTNKMNSSTTSSGHSSRNASRQNSMQRDGQAPAYMEVADEATSTELVRSGRAERVVDYDNEKVRRVSGQSLDSSSEIYDYYYEGPPALTNTGDEAAWELDDMAGRVGLAENENENDAGAGQPQPGDSEEVKEKKEAVLVRNLVRLAGPPPTPARPIPCPVIIPQRRPGKRARGFVRAYAPVLNDCGIPQDVFLSFLKTWHQASKASRWIDVLIVAAGIAGCVPEAGAQIASAVIQVAAGAAREMQSRRRGNTFLDRANNELFMPRGLFAMVVAFKDNLPGESAGQKKGLINGVAGLLGQNLFAVERLDVGQTVAKHSQRQQQQQQGGAGKMKQMKQSFKTNSGTTYTELELPQAAELVYPDLDRAAQTDLEAVQHRGSSGKGKEAEEKTIKEKWRNTGKFVQDYLDRRAQASYEYDHQGSSLAVPASVRTPFASRYSDPNHPASSGSLIALLTGGVIPGIGRTERQPSDQPKGPIEQAIHLVKNQINDKSGNSSGLGSGTSAFATARRSSLAQQFTQSPAGSTKRVKKDDGGLIGKALKQDVLYLLIVNLPSDEQTRSSVAELQRLTGRT